MDEPVFTVEPTRGGAGWYVRGPDGKGWGSATVKSDARRVAVRLNRAYALGREDYRPERGE